MKKKKVFNFLLFFALFTALSASAYADESSQAFKAIFDNAKAQSGDAVIATVVDALYNGLIIIFRGVSTKITGVAGAFMVMLLALDSVKTILASLNSIDYASIMKKLMPNLIKGGMILAFLVAPMPQDSNMPGSALPSGISSHGTMYTWFVEKLFKAFYKLGLYFFGEPKMMNLSVGKMADVFFSTPLNLLMHSITTWTLFAVFTNIIKILALVFCVWMASKILSTLIANTFSALMICVFSVFFLMFMLFESTKSLSQRGVNTVIAQTVTIFMTVGMVGLSYQVMKLISVDNSIAGILTLAVLLMMMQQCTENVNSMANAMVNGSGLGNSNSAGFMGMLGALGSIVGGGLLMATETVDNVAADFKDGVIDSKSQSLGGKAFDGFKTAAKNSVAGQAGAGVASAIHGKYSKAKAMKDMMGKGQDFFTAARNARLLGDAQKAFKNKEKALRELEKRKHGIGKGSIAAIGTNVMISALTGNLHDTKVLNSIGQRLTGDKSVSDTELKTAQQEMLNAAATLKILENANHIKVQGKHNDIDFENLEKYKGDKQMEEFIKHQGERIEEAKNGKIDPKELQSDLDKAKNDAEKTVESEGGKMMRTGAEELSNFFKEDVQLGVVDGKGGQAQTDKAKDGNGNQGNVSTNRDSSGSSGHEDNFKTDFTKKKVGDKILTNEIDPTTLTLNRNNEGNSGTPNKPDKPESTTFSTNGSNVTVAGNSGFFSNNSTSSSVGTSANVQENLFGYSTAGTSKVESISAGTGNAVTASSDIGTARSKTKEATASNTEEPKVSKINTNNITIGKNNIHNKE